MSNDYRHASEVIADQRAESLARRRVYYIGCLAFLSLTLMSGSMTYRQLTDRNVARNHKEKNVYQIYSVKNGPCPLCVGKGAEKDRKLFVVDGPGFTGDICPEHLAVLVEKNGKHVPDDRE